MSERGEPREQSPAEKPARGRGARRAWIALAVWLTACEVGAPEPPRVQAPPEPLPAPVVVVPIPATGWAGACDPKIPEWVRARVSKPKLNEGILRCAKRLTSETDPRIPFDQRYDLTTFGGPGDMQPTQCSADADGTWYYAANRQRFGCGQKVRLVNRDRTRCVVVEVADLGPHICVEAAGGRPAWDVSPLVSRHLFGVSGVGWSEHREVVGAPVAQDNPLGPCEAPKQIEQTQGFVGGRCSNDSDCPTGGRCLTEQDGWPGGYCTASCSGTCPTRSGAVPLSSCARAPDGQTSCLARCDFTLFRRGCREGYACTFAPSADTAWNEKPPAEQSQVCVPQSCPVNEAR